MLAGFMIGIGAIIYLSVGGVAGALLFAVGLMTVIYFKFNLFTGKAGLLATEEITLFRVAQIWCWNYIGSFAAAALLFFTPRFDVVMKSASKIAETRIGNGPISNFALGAFCGLLMYCAVQGFKLTGSVLCIYVPVAVFILAGFNHAIADMFYGWAVKAD